MISEHETGLALPRLPTGVWPAAPLRAASDPLSMGPTDAAARHVEASNLATERFFLDASDEIARTCQAMATRFASGGRLLAYAAGVPRGDVGHLVVEFVHPVVMGKRALPALPLGAHGDGGAQQALSVLGRDHDIVLVLCTGEMTAEARDTLAAARERGMLTVLLGHEGMTWAADHAFRVPSSDPCIVQEVHELLYHVLWELVHVFLEHCA